MGTTIKDIAEKAGVSIATVSHAINHTRYVSPELVKKIEEIINASDYRQKLDGKRKKLLAGKQSIIAMVIPGVLGTLFVQLVTRVAELVQKRGYTLSTYVTDDDGELERKLLMKLVTDKSVAGIILSPCQGERKKYEKILSYHVPMIFLERKVEGLELDSVLSENEVALYKATSHLIKSGHEKIAIVLGDRKNSTVQGCLRGYQRALGEGGISYSEKYVLSIAHADLLSEKERNGETIQNFYLKHKPSAIICCGNQLTFMVLRMIQFMGLECPHDISIIGYGDEEWCELIVPPLTVLKQNTCRMAEMAVEKIFAKLEKRLENSGEVKIPMDLIIRKSTQMIGRGPFGEKAFSPDDIVLTEKEKEQLQQGDFKVGISFHYSGTAWKNLHENGIRQTLEKYGITVVAVTDAHFDPYLQVTQLEGIGMQQPDAVIAIPADDSVTASTFKKLAKKTKLIFLSNVPEGFNAEDYVSCVSVNERENGCIAGTLLGDYFKGYKKVKVGFINHGASFYGTHLRDMIATQAVCENYPNIEVAAVKRFQNIEDAYDICKNMIQLHPDIEGLYISWDRPALQAIRALEELGREDIAVFTFDLDEQISKYLVQGKFVKGMSTQRPYEQGVAVAMATAKALVGGTTFKYIGVSPYIVQKGNFLRAWKDIMHEPAPKNLEQYLEKEPQKE